MLLEHITSAANPLLKEVRRAQQRGTVTSQGLLVAEGPHLVQEASRSGLRIVCAVVSQGVSLPAGVRADRVLQLSENVFRTVSATETPQGMLVLAESPVHSLASIYGDSRAALIVVLDAVQDPGNAGAIARSAEAFGATGIIFYGETANPLNPKTLRASAGSLFRLPFVRCARTVELSRAIPYFAGGISKSSHIPRECDFRSPCHIVIGNEGAGVSEELMKRSTSVSIPTTGVESLNAAVAAGILLYEAARQRAPKDAR